MLKNLQKQSMYRKKYSNDTIDWGTAYLLHYLLLLHYYYNLFPKIYTVLLLNLS